MHQDIVDASLNGSVATPAFSKSSKSGRRLHKKDILSAPQKPPAPTVDFGRIPLELRGLARWVGWCWRRDGKSSKWKKPPVDAKTGGVVTALDDASWLSFNNASTLYFDHDYDGLGFVLNETPVACVDLDDCRDPMTGDLTEPAQSIVDLLQSYTEVSPSGTGVKIFVIGDLPSGHRTQNLEGTVEIFTTGRYVTVTGQQYGDISEIAHRPAELLEVWREHIGCNDAIDPAESSVGHPLRSDAVAIQSAVQAMLRATSKLKHDNGDGSSRLVLCMRCVFNESLTDEAALKAFYMYALERPFPQHWTDAEILTRLRDVERRGGERQPSKPPLTDVGNAERFARRHGDRVRYVSDLGVWRAWNGKRWSADSAAAVQSLAIETLRSMLTDSASMDNDSDRKALVKHALASEAEPRIRRMLKLAQNMLTAKQSEFDSDPYLFNCDNGTIDLQTGKLRPHDKADMLTKVTPFECEPNETSSAQWDGFLKKTFANDPELIAFLQRLLGYAMIGNQDEHILPIFYGTGANGKSTLVNTIRRAFGSYAKKLPEDYFVQRQQKQHSTELMLLQGVRLADDAETGEGARLNEARIKQLTGGDRISGRRLYSDFSEFAPTHTFIMQTNHRPQVLGTDDGIWRRLLLIPFSNTVPVRARDPKLSEKLAEEIPAILRWMVEGSLAYQADGLSPPKSVLAATQAYREESDRLGQFIEEECVREPGAKARAKRLYEAYKKWSEQRGQGTWSQQRFSQALVDRGFESERDRDSRFYRGLKIANRPD